MKNFIVRLLKIAAWLTLGYLIGMYQGIDIGIQAGFNKGLREGYKRARLVVHRVVTPDQNKSILGQPRALYEGFLTKRTGSVI